MTLKVTTINDQACVVLPPDVLEALDLQPGDNVDLQRARATAQLSETDRQVEVAKEIMIKRREVLRRLAE